MAHAREIRIMQDGDELAREAAELFLWLGEQALAANGRFRVALAGGTTPATLHATLASSEYAHRLDWKKVRFFFGDERCVPPSHAESNFGMANATLFQPLKIAPEQIFRMKGEEPPEAAARQYEQLLRQEWLGSDPSLPRFDLILLGLGEDGHTASLFPGTSALHEQTRLVVPGTAPKGIQARVTLTFPVLNRASVVLFLATGRQKAGIARMVLEKAPADAPSLPAALVCPASGRLIWFLDRAAAAELTASRQGMSSHEE